MTDGSAKPKTLHYRRSHFATQLPVDYLYSPSHCWLAAQAGGVWRVGMTKFATRMLGDMVDCGFELAAGTPVTKGEIIGWIEGFKAISDVYCVLDGKYVSFNPVLKQKIAVVDKEPYSAGWLYEVAGKPDDRCMDVHTYKVHLDATIGRILAKQESDESK